jgi:CheY-like chemotaxis protein
MAAAMTAALTVLVVDDVEDQRELLRTHLERAGCIVHAIGDPTDLPATVARTTPDAAIVDLLMPSSDGWTVLETLRRTHPSMTLVVASVLDASDYPESDETLPKPFTGSDVRALVARLEARR